MSFSADDREELRKIIGEVLDSHRDIDRNRHRDHHIFIHDLVEKHKKNEKLVENLKQQIIGWGFISFLAGMGYGAYLLFIQFIEGIKK